MGSRRRRLGVAVVFDHPVREEVQGLRRALGDPSLERIEPHVTLVPPVNVRAGDLPSAIERLRLAAGAQPGPFRLTLGPPATFLPHNPVAYLQVGGDLESLRKLRDDVFVTPLERVLTWPWVPHVTLADGIAEAQIATALSSLRAYVAVAPVDRVVLLEETDGRVWRPLADACLEPAAVVGAGGFALRITRGRVLDPDARTALEGKWDPAACPPSLFPPIVLTGHREGRFVGTAGAWVSAGGAEAAVFVDPASRGEGVGGHLLAHLESAARGAGWAFPELGALGPPGFYESRSAWLRVPTRTPPTRTSPAS